MFDFLQIDIDGTLRNLEPNIQRVLQKYHPELDVVCKHPDKWYINERYPYWKTPKYADRFVFVHAAEETFMTAEPFPGALQFILDIQSADIPFVYHTHQSIYSRDYIAKWLEKHSFPAGNGIIITDSSIPKNIVTGGLLIDDGAHNIEKHPNTILVDREWNRHLNHKSRCYTYAQILDEIKRRY